MVRKITFIIALLFLTINFAQEKKAFKGGEWLKYKMSYSGFLKAGEAELTLTEENYAGKKIFHSKGTGKTSSVVSWFFKVRDRYETFFGADNMKPYKFIRDVSEGGHKIRRDILFKKDKAHIKDYRNNTNKVKNAPNVQDMISSFYYLRNQNTSNMKKGDEIAIDMFFDGSTFPFKLRYLGNQVIKTSFGNVKTQIFRPIVQSGRVFKAQESVTVWVTADDNKIPVYIKADLAVGSLRASLKDYKNLANPFKVVSK